MTTRHAILSSCVILASVSAYADIGPIGSPVKPSNPPVATPAAQNASTDSTAENAVENNTTGDDADNRTPLVVIRFNQNHVYFQRALRQAVEATSRAKPGAFYEVVSIVPVGGTMEQSERISANAADNLNDVVQELQNLGVSSSQMRTSTQSSSTAIAQEVDIFVE